MVKKLLLVTIVLFLLFWAGVCFFIPNPLKVSTGAYLKSPVKTITHFAFDTSTWQRWWPGSSSNGQYHLRDYSYQMITQNTVSASLLAKNSGDSFMVELTILPASRDSTVTAWKTELPASLNPFTRIKQYQHAVRVKEDLQTLTDSLIAFAGNKVNVYGMEIQEANFTNPFMISTKTELAGYPTVEKMYELINHLRAYQKTQGAEVVDSPMVNIDVTGKSTWLLRAALPVNKKLTGINTIDFRQMVLGKTLVATVTGGRARVEEALLQMQQYISDYRRTSPAIPFQLLVTNRQQQPDSSKWITKLYYPVY